MKCLRCGQCCHLLVIIDGVGRPSNIPCAYLKHKKNGKTFCSVYKNRLGRRMELGKWKHQILPDGVRLAESICGKRVDSLFDYEGCPYNTNKPLVKKT